MRDLIQKAFKLFYQPAGTFGKSRALKKLKVGMHFLMDYALQGDFAFAFIGIDQRFWNPGTLY